MNFEANYHTDSLEMPPYKKTPNTYLQNPTTPGLTRSEVTRP